jgi:hypothetical protein
VQCVRCLSVCTVYVITNSWADSYILYIFDTQVSLVLGVVCVEVKNLRRARFNGLLLKYQWVLCACRGIK